MATGYTDENGFYHYGEDDLADPGQGFSELLNRSAEGVKTAVPIIVHNRVVDELNSDPTIRETTALRFDEEVADRNLVESTDDRLLKRSVAQRLSVQSDKGLPIASFSAKKTTLANDVQLTGAVVKASTGFGVSVGERSPIWVDPKNGDIHMAGMIIRAGQGFRIGDENEKEIFNAAGSASTGAPTRVVPLFVTGQSNADGRAMPFSDELDPQDERVLMWDHTSNALVTATVPLSSRQPNARAGLSVAHVMAREILKSEPAGTIVAIINTAVGGSGLVAGGSGTRWLWGATGSLAPGAISVMNNAMTSLAQRFPNARIEMPRGLWGQGEADSNGPAYVTALTEVLTQMAAGIGFPSMTWTLTGIVPEYIAKYPNRAAIREAHMDLPRLKTRTAYADGIPGGGGSYDVDDIVHYNRGGVLRLGEAAYRAYQRAAVNTSTSVPVPPLDLYRTPTGVEWSMPLCRVTGFLVEKSTDNGTTWSTVARSLPLDPRATVTGPTLIRVSTVNEVGTSAPTTPLLIGA
jgi:hypothetical protein